jgi:hypothetical protein
MTGNFSAFFMGMLFMSGIIFSNRKEWGAVIAVFVMLILLLVTTTRPEGWALP